MAKLYLEDAIQTRIAQIIDEYECKNQVYEKFGQQLEEIMKYTPDSEMGKCLELESLFHARISDLIEFTYRALVNDTLNKLVDQTNEKAFRLSS